MSYAPPSFKMTAFNCPYCKAYSQRNLKNFYLFEGSLDEFKPLKAKECQHCEKMSYWLNEEMISPVNRAAPDPNIDMAEPIKAIYNEAASIEQASPRGAAALLRLCIQLLCKEVGESGENINSDIKSLVSKGLPVELQQALDTVRVVGNNAVHPGSIQINETRDTVSALFILTNTLCDRLISQPKRMAELYGALPPSIRDAVRKRDEPKA